jgi:hypothetical protein
MEEGVLGLFACFGSRRRGRGNDFYAESGEFCSCDGGGHRKGEGLRERKLRGRGENGANDGNRIGPSTCGAHVDSELYC